MKLKLLYLGLASLMLLSCGGDDDSPSINSGELTKKWYIVSDVVGGVTIPYDDNEVCGKDYLEFIEGGVVRAVDVWDCEQDPDVILGVWNLSGNKLTITTTYDGEEDDVEVVTIKKLDSDILQVQVMEDYDGDGDQESVLTNFTSIP